MLVHSPSPAAGIKPCCPHTGIAKGAAIQLCKKAEQSLVIPVSKNLPYMLSLSLVICFLTCNQTDCRASGNSEHGSLEVQCSVILLKGKLSEYLQAEPFTAIETPCPSAKGQHVKPSWARSLLHGQQFWQALRRKMHNFSIPSAGSSCHPACLLSRIIFAGITHLWGGGVTIHSGTNPLKGLPANAALCGKLYWCLCVRLEQVKPQHSKAQTKS